MADSKISALTNYTSPQSADVLPIVNVSGSTTEKVTMANLAANLPSITTSGVNVTGLTASEAVQTDGSKNLVSVANTGTGNNVLASSPTLVTPVLGTPTSGTLTNCTGLPISTGVSGLGSGVATWAATPSFTNLNSALTGDSVAGLSATQTILNKRITKRFTTIMSNSATPTISTDAYEVVHITSQTAAITSFTTNLTGTPVDGDTLRISITGTTSIALTWGSSFESSTVTLPTTTSSTTRLDVGFFWNTETSKWRCIALA